MVGCRLSSEPVIFLYYSIVVINYAVIPQLLLKKLCLRENAYNKTLCEDPKAISHDIYEDASTWWFHLLICFQIPAIFTVLIGGPITDLIGRRKGLICFPLVDALASIVFLLNAYFINAHPAFLIPGYLLISLFGESQGVIYLCYAFVADITKDKCDHRTSRMALVEASLHSSAVFAGLLTGYLLRASGFVSVFVFSIGIDGLILFYVSCYLSRYDQDNVPSSETKQLIKQDSCEDADGNDLFLRNCVDQGDEGNSDEENSDEINTDNGNGSEDRELSGIRTYFQQMKGIIKVMQGEPVVIPMIFSFMFIFFGVLGEQIVQTLYLKNNPFAFSPEDIGYYIAVQGASRAIGTVLVSQLSFYCLHCNDYGLMVIGAISQMLSFILIGVSRSKLSVFLSTIASFALPVSMLTIRSVLTKNVLSDKYGTVLALLASLNIISGLITNTISLWIFELTLSVFTGIVYFGLAAFAGAAIIIIITTYIKIERQKGNNNSS